MANNSIKIGTQVRWCTPGARARSSHHIKYPDVFVEVGMVVANSRLSNEHVIVEWYDSEYPVSVEHCDDLIEVK